MRLSTVSGMSSNFTSVSTAWGIDIWPYVSSSSGRAPKPARRSRCSTSRSEVRGIVFPAHILGMRRPLDNKIRAKLPPDEPACQDRRAREQPPPQAAIRPPADGELHHLARRGRFTSRALNRRRDPAPVGEEIALDQNGIPKLGANFVIARAAVSCRQAGHIVVLGNGRRRKISRHHCVIDPLGGESVHESA